MLFSVIIPTYNRRELLHQALTSVWEQRFCDYEVIVVDDGSTDSTWEYLLELAPRLRAFRQDNNGPGSARNRGIAEASGEYVAFLDSDDVWFPWTLSHCAELIDKYDRPSFIAGKPFMFGGNLQVTDISDAMLSARAFPDYLASHEQWSWFGVSSFVIRRDVLIASGGFRPGHVNGEDADLALRIGCAPDFVQVLSPATFGYRSHPTNITSVLPRTVEAGLHLVKTERQGVYPGGEGRASERRRIIARHVRPVSLECLRKHDYAPAWELYWTTWIWNAHELRWKYLLAFPVCTLTSLFHRIARN